MASGRFVLENETVRDYMEAMRDAIRILSAHKRVQIALVVLPNEQVSDRYDHHKH